MGQCIRCKQKVDWNEVMQTIAGEEVAYHADIAGPTSLSEYDQLIHHGKICADCIIKDEEENNDEYSTIYDW